MTFEADLLKGKYFPEGSRERLKAVMLSLIVYLPILAMVYDYYESVEYGYETMQYIELFILVLIFAVYALFPRFIGLTVTTNLILALFAIFLLLSLVVEDKNAAFSLFWFSMFPVISFFFLGKKQGLVWTAIISFSLFVLLALSLVGVIVPLYDNALLFQIFGAYLAFSFIIYMIEKERAEYEKQLNAAFERNKLLFKDVHHRTKNNMQVMMGLLETQSFRVDDPKYKKMFQAHVDRIKAMSFVHENLYSGASFEEVDMHTYLTEIVDSLQKVTQHTILADIDYMTLGVNDSINLGLIVNEAVSNAIEHAYSAGNGKIDVSLKYLGRRCVLSVKDEGVGLNPEKEYQSLGMTLIEDLAKSLPGGKLEIKVEHGTQIQVYFDAKEKE
ncbi:MAG: sensor histidine kinase [Sulfurovum sp.]|nr:sensor histidine kinase [Sulfurovum sp.]